MIYAYLRVSTDKQTLESQAFEIKNFCAQQNLKIDRWIMEKISGITDFEKRELGKILKRLRKNDILICSEISRLGRNLLQIMTLLNLCMKKEAKIWTIKDHFRLGTDIQSKVLAFAFSLSAEIERNLISQRTKEALHCLQAKGQRLGRAYGSRNKKHILDGKETQLKILLSQNYSKRRIAQILGVSERSIYNFLERNA